ncbi:MAG: acyltransferase, partial [Pseudomonadota bacterium]
MTRNSARRADRREKRQVARDITYATSVASKAAQTMVRVMENATGRIGLIKRAEGYQDEIRLGGNFWEIMVERYGLSLDVVGGSLDNIPETGPVLVVANHPYGILDGLMLGHIMSKRRGDFRILAHRVFRKAEDLDNVILPISFDES